MGNNILKNFVPYKLTLENNEAFCKWLYVDDIPFTKPFFDETISECLQYKSSYGQICSLSDIDVLPEWANNLTTVKPSAFIFHVSRCGSTLAAQLLGLNPNHIVLAEVPFFDELLRYRFKSDMQSKEKLLKTVEAAINFYGQKRTGQETHLFIKTDCWHSLFYKEIRQLYPDVPFILLYRKPDEVIKSHQKRRGIQAVPGVIEPELFGFDAVAIKELNLDEYIAKVQERLYESFLEILANDDLAFPINYNEGALALIEKIGDVSKLSFTETELDEIKTRSNYHSKYPEEIFSETKIAEEIPAYQNRVFELYYQIEKIRNSNSFVNFKSSNNL